MDAPAPRSPRSVLLRFAPPLIWMAVILVFSSSFFGSDRTRSLMASGAIHVVLRKLGHLVEYGVLAVLWRRALAPTGPPGRAGLWAVLLSTAYAVLDEARQGLAGNRSSSAWDVGLDAVGAILAVAWHDAPNRVARATLGLARGVAAALAVGSLAAALLEVALGLSAWDLALAALGLALVWWGLGRVPGRWRSTA